jgi:hypothetical protein
MKEYQLTNLFKVHNCSNLINEKTNWSYLEEVQIGSKIADLVIYDEKIKTIIAIEFKIDKWKDAFKQALNYQLWANKSFVALPEENIKPALKNRDIFEEFGIGLIEIGEKCDVKIIAKKSQYISPKYKILIKEKIKSNLATSIRYAK